MESTEEQTKGKQNIKINIDRETEHITDISEDNSDKKQKYKVMSLVKLGRGNVFRLLSTPSGIFVDIRKFHIDHYTSRGFRIPIIKFFQGCDQLRVDYNTLK